MKNYKFNINGASYTVNINNVDDHIIQLELNGTPYEVTVEKELKQVKTPKLVRSYAVPSTDNTKEVVKTQAAGKIGTIKTPLPGVILEVNVKVGDRVSIGQQLLILEAMKMENRIDSDLAGVVTQINVDRGSSVLEGDALITIGE
ncbi:MAG: biotin/lipoyl-binding protein [Bacteroidia bacterium]|nr:biotin/lipoyl-binding protein [Bacteroidia bacterium]